MSEGSWESVGRPQTPQGVLLKAESSISLFHEEVGWQLLLHNFAQDALLRSDVLTLKSLIVNDSYFSNFIDVTLVSEDTEDQD